LDFRGRVFGKIKQKDMRHDEIDRKDDQGFAFFALRRVLRIDH